MSYQNRMSQADPYRAESRKSKIWLIVGAFILVMLGGFALGAGGVLGMGSRSDSGNVAIVGADGADPLAQSLGDGGSPATLLGGGLSQPLTQQVAKGRAPAAQRLGNGYQPPRLQSGFDPNPPATQQFDRMPADVRAWLEHLERTEDERVRLSKKQLGKMMGQMMSMGAADINDLVAEAFGEESKGAGQNYDPSQRSQVGSDTQGLRQSWRELNTFFNSAQPPRECVPIKNAYEQCLGETSAMMLDVLGALEESRDDPNGAISRLMQMMGTSEGKIDVAAKQSDRLVRDICREYETFKWFKISGDVGGGLGVFGGLGSGLGGLGGLLGGG